MEQINKICNATTSDKITTDERNTINKIFFNNGYDLLATSVSLKSKRDGWFKKRNIL